MERYNRIVSDVMTIAYSVHSIPCDSSLAASRMRLANTATKNMGNAPSYSEVLSIPEYAASSTSYGSTSEDSEETRSAGSDFDTDVSTEGEGSFLHEEADESSLVNNTDADVFVLPRTALKKLATPALYTDADVCLGLVFRCAICQMTFHRDGGPQHCGLLEIEAFQGCVDAESIRPVLQALTAWCDQAILQANFVVIFDISSMSTPSIFGLHSLYDEISRQLPSLEAFRTYMQRYAVIRGDSHVINAIVDTVISLSGAETMPCICSDRYECWKALSE